MSKKPTNMSKETYKYVKRNLQICQNTPTNILEATKDIKRDLHKLSIMHTYGFGGGQVTQIYQKTYKYVKRDLQICQNRRTNMSKETYKYFKRDLHLLFIMHTHGFGGGQVTQKCQETYKYVKRDLQICPKKNVRRDTYT